MMRIGRYALYDKLASGGMAAVHLGQMFGGAGFARTVAIKRLHPHVAETPGALKSFLDEAWLSARVRHRNVVPTLDVVEHEGEVLLVFEYVHGASLSALVELAKREGTTIPFSIAIAVILDVLSGLQAVHEATDEHDQPLSIVHRDVSPQNVMIGVDGVARVLDFGIAKASARVQATRGGEIKGKLRYMAPEQLLHEPLGPRVDVYASGVVLWELLAGERLFDATSEAAIMAKVLAGVVLPPSTSAPHVSPELDAIVMRALSRDPSARLESCKQMAAEIRAVAQPAAADEVGVWVKEIAKDTLVDRAERVARIERGEAGAAPAVEQPAEETETHRDAQPPTRPRSRRWLWAVAALVVVAPVAFFGARALKKPPAPPPEAVPVTLTNESPSSPSPPPNAATTAVPPQESARRPPSVSRPAPPHPKKPPKTRDCDPMYTVDSTGIRHAKPDCL